MGAVRKYKPGPPKRPMPCSPTSQHNWKESGRFLEGPYGKAVVFHICSHCGMGIRVGIKPYHKGTLMKPLPKQRKKKTGH